MYTVQPNKHAHVICCCIVCLLLSQSFQLFLFLLRLQFEALAFSLGDCIAGGLLQAQTPELSLRVCCWLCWLSSASAPEQAILTSSGPVAASKYKDR
jgi:hypothetical protein